MKELKINPEFRDKIPPLTQAEFAQLRENILSDGEVYEPIVVWDGTIIDGHNRWRVIQKHPEIPFRIKEMDFADQWAAFEWMYKKQLGRRNLTDEQKSYMIGKMYEARRKSVGEHEGNQYTRMEAGQNVHFPTPRDVKDGTAGQIGKEVGVNEKTVRRAAGFAKGVDALKEVSPEAAEKVLSGKSNVTKTIISSVPKMEQAERREVAEVILNDQKRPSRNPSGYSKEERALTASIRSIVEDMRNPDRAPEFGLADLLDELENGAESYIRQIRLTVRSRKNLFAGSKADRDDVLNGLSRIKDQIDQVMEEIENERI